MTEELRKRANVLAAEIQDLEAQIQIVEDMHHCDNNLHIECTDVGAISIAGDEELKDDILDMILNRLYSAKEDKEDEFRML